MRDFANDMHPVRAISPAAATADNTPWVSQIIDRAGFEGLVFLMNTGGEVDADATFTALVEDGDQANLSDAATVDPSLLTGTVALASFTFADDNETRKIGYVGRKRYVRLTVTPANNASAAYLSAIALLLGPRFAPTPNPPM